MIQRLKASGFGWQEQLHWFVQRGIDLLFPPQCLGCGRSGYQFCPACAQAVQPISPPICARCGRPQTAPTRRCRLCRQIEDNPLQMVRVATVYTDPIRTAIHRLKYEQCPELSQDLARYLVAVYRQGPWTTLPDPIDVCLPVPLHRQRMAERGYNQSALLAAAFGRRVGTPVQPGWIVRHQQTRSQVGLSAAERRQNVAGAFRAAPAVADRVVLLIDDVFTTGSTLMACAGAAREAGATAVYGLVLATPIPGSHAGDAQTEP